VERGFEPSLAELVRKLRSPRRISGPLEITDPLVWEPPDPADPNTYVMPEDEAISLAIYALYEDEEEDERL
jgi:hypothetical protein